MTTTFQQLTESLKGLSSNQVLSALQEDQVVRWGTPTPILVEDYLDNFPGIADDQEAAMVLILGEILQREARGETVTEAEYLQRLPRYHDAIRMQLALHQAMGHAGSSATSSLSGSSSSPVRDLKGLVIAEKYKLRECIGEGGMGTVWRADQLHPVKRQVALKLIKPGMDTRTVMARFEAERQALALMDHPNIAKVLDGGVTDRQEPYFVMELVKGVSITEYCDARKLTPRARLELFLPVCHAIQHAHQKGIIHRDIKPSNVLIALYDEKAVAKVIDFGVAKATQSPLTEATLDTGIGTVLGTPEYMSPEQASLNNLDIDTRSDVYSLGVLLYELLAGSPPFPAQQLRLGGLIETLRMIREDEPPRPSTKLSTAEALPSISACRSTEPKKLTGMLRNELDWIVMKALEKDRSRRYETANGMASDLQRYLLGEPVLAHPPSVIYRLQKFVRRYQMPVIAASLVLGTLLAGIAGTTYGLFHAEEQRSLADQARDAESKQLQKTLAEKAKAEQAELQTLNAYRASTDAAIEQLIGSKQDLGPRERAYLEKVLKIWQDFANREGDDQRSRAIRAEGHFRVAYLWDKLGRNSEALAEYQLAYALRKVLVEQHPQLQEYQQSLANILYNRGTIFKDLNRWDEALNHCHAARDIEQRLVEQYPDNGEYSLELSRTHNALGLIHQSLAQYEKAAAEFQAARQLQQKLVERFPNVWEYQQELAGSYHNLGLLLRVQNQPADSVVQFRLSRDMNQKLLLQHPDSPLILNAVASNCTGLASSCMLMGKYDESKEASLSALKILKKLVALYPSVPEYQKILATTHTNYGSLLLVVGNHAEAQAEFQSARTLWKQLSAGFPIVTDYQLSLAGTYCNIGYAALTQGKPADSMKQFDEALLILRRLLEKQPDNANTRKFLVNTYAGRAYAFYRMKQFVASINSWDEALKLSTPEDTVKHRANRANALGQAGRIQEAIAEVADLTVNVRWPDGSAKWSGQNWFDFACVYAAGSSAIIEKRQEYADRAMELLQQAIKSGYQDVASMRKETVLNPLRSREDFKKLLDALQQARK